MVKLNEITTIKLGLVLDRKKASMGTESKFSYRVVSLKSFNENGIFEDKHCDEFHSNELIKDEYMLNKGDVLLRLREPNFAVYIDSEYKDLIFSSLMVRLRVKDERFNPNFLAHYLNSGIVRRSLSSAVSGTMIPMIKVSDINEIKVPLISHNEQEKIVKYLKLANHHV